ncbi:MAG: methyltransferase domain-containing protein [Chloroflexi bacterium]|jgi:ubiquinone/menaquinone biosynthesis C-methylase UbiE|nr:methyltransferase domain-containing protein [Chloroflexota bacterium]MBT5627733.1 methyltransferase domain-containing protein [Chloroflexota bacterium]
MTEQKFDDAKAEAFGDRLMDMLNLGSLALMTSIGHRTGLFDSMAGLAPSTSQQIADAAGLNERYVREWLGAMLTGGFVEYSADSKTYSLPAEHAALLTRDASPDNIAAFAQYIPLLGSVEDGIVDAFKNGGGVPYSGFPRFQEVMAEDSGQTVVPALLSHILPLGDGLVARLEAGIDVLDVGCGAGRALNIMAAEFPNSRFTGSDISEEGLGIGRAAASKNGLNNLKFEVGDATDLGYSEEFDLITTFDAVHDQADPDAVLASIARALRNDGLYLMQDIKASSEVQNNVEHPAGPFLYTISTMHCMTVSLAVDGKGLGTMWGHELALEMLGDAGFANVEVKQLEHDFQNEYFLSTK